MKVYIPTPISNPPEKDGWYYVMNPNKEIMPRMVQFYNGNWSNWQDVNIEYYLKPVSLTDLLGEAIEWGIAIGRDGEEHNETKIFNSIIEKFVSPQTTKTT